VLLGDVVDHRDDVARVPVRRADEGQHDVGPDRGAVHVRVGPCEPGAVEGALLHLAQPAPQFVVLGRDVVVDAAVQDRRGAVPEHGAERPVDLDDLAVAGDDRDADGRVGEERAEAGLAGPACLLGGGAGGEGGRGDPFLLGAGALLQGGRVPGGQRGEDSGAALRIGAGEAWAEHGEGVPQCRRVGEVDLDQPPARGVGLAVAVVVPDADGRQQRGGPLCERGLQLAPVERHETGRLDGGGPCGPEFPRLGADARHGTGRPVAVPGASGSSGMLALPLEKPARESWTCR
jgi:hypothetical protein